MHWIRKVWTVTWKIVLFLVLWAILLSPTILILESAEGTASAETRLLLELLGALSVLVAAWALLRFIDHRPLISLGLRRGKVVRDLVFGIVLGAAMISLAVAILWAAGWAERVGAPTFSWPALGLMGAAILLNSVTQEVLVRGYVLQTLESQFGVAVAVIVSSVFFTALHAGVLAEGGFLPAINLLAAGVLLGLAYTTTGNLWLPIALHFSWNFFQGPVLGIAVSGQALDSGWRLVELDGPAIFTGGSFGLEGGLIATLVTVLGIAALIVAGRRLSP